MNGNLLNNMNYKRSCLSFHKIGKQIKIIILLQLMVIIMIKMIIIKLFEEYDLLQTNNNK
jgi:hypothetical protein